MMLQGHDRDLPEGDRDRTPEELQQIWLSNELMKRVKEVAHDIDKRIHHVLQELPEPEAPTKV